jgi:hypothetical protein
MHACTVIRLLARKVFPKKKNGNISGLELALVCYTDADMKHLIKRPKI